MALWLLYDEDNEIIFYIESSDVLGMDRYA